MDLEKISLDDVKKMEDGEFRQFVYLNFKSLNEQYCRLYKELKWNRWLVVSLILLILGTLLKGNI